MGEGSIEPHHIISNERSATQLVVEILPQHVHLLVTIAKAFVHIMENRRIVMTAIVNHEAFPFSGVLCEVIIFFWGGLF